VPKATTKKEATTTFDQQIIDTVVKQVLTPERMTALATKMAPAIEKQFSKAVEKFVETMFDDNWRLADMLGNDQVIRDALLIGLRKAVGVEEKAAKMIKLPKREAKAKGGLFNDAAAPRGNW
jgi:hypothetical protein